jgi:hypothetical protein
MFHFRNKKRTIHQKTMANCYDYCVSRKLKIRKKRYTSPSFRVLDAETAKAELEAKGQPGDPRVQEMLRAIDQKLNADKKLKSKLDKSA